MTSKSSFIKLQLEDLRQRLWLIALSLIGFLFAYPIRCGLLFSAGLDGRNAAENYTLLRQATEPFTGNVFYYGLLIPVAALFCALSGFSYLTSRKKTDFYHSMPLRRERLFAIRFVNGLLIFYLPYLFSALLALLISAANGYCTASLLRAFLCGSAMIFLTFFAYYTTSVLALLLSGHLLIGITIALSLFALAPLYLQLFQALQAHFFETYSYSSQADVLNATRYLSPFSFSIYLERYYSTHGSLSPLVLLYLLEYLLLTGLALFVYRKRPSEAAGKAIAFRVLESVLRMLVVVFLAIYGGYVFYRTTDSNVWLFFGCALFGILTFCIMNTIFRFDIHKLFLDRLQLPFCLGIPLLALLIFRVDLFGYDTYLPDQSQLSGMSFSMNALSDNSLNYSLYKQDGALYFSWTNSQKHALDTVLVDYNPLYDIARASVKNEAQSLSIDGEPITVRYFLTDGRSVYRQYQIDVRAQQQALSSLYQESAVKLALHPLLNYEPEQLKLPYTQLELSKDNQNKQLTLNEEQLVAFLTLYREDFLSLSLDDLAAGRTQPVASWNFPNTTGFHSIAAPIYDCFTETLSFLSSLGFDGTQTGSDYPILFAIISQSGWNESASVLPAATVSEESYLHPSETSDEVLRLTDEAEIRALLPLLTETTLTSSRSRFLSFEKRYSVSILYLTDDYGNYSPCTYYFKNSALVPAWISEYFSQIN